MQRFLLLPFLFLANVLASERPPVILVDGYHLLCDSGDLVVSGHDFGDLQPRLEAQGVTVTFLGTCSMPGKPSIEELGNALAATIQRMNAPEVDLVTNSMGGLIVRAYLSGMQTAAGVFRPPESPRVRKWVAIATPNFGAMLPGGFAAFLPDTQAREMTPGSQFLFDLATWNQNQDDLRGVDAIGIIGNAGGWGLFEGASDGTVAVTSASLSFAKEDERTRLLPYCHGAGDFTSILGFGCNAPPLAKMQSDNPLSWQIVDSFLSGTDVWKTIGHTPSKDKYLSRYGGILSQSRDPAGKPSGAVQEQNFIAGAPSPGTYSVRINKPGPRIALIAPAAARLPSLSLAPRMWISIYGDNLADATASVNGEPLPLSYTGEHQINALLPGKLSGLAKLTVAGSSGSDAVNVLVEDARRRCSRGPVPAAGKLPRSAAATTCPYSSPVWETKRATPWSSSKVTSPCLPATQDRRLSFPG